MILVLAAAAKSSKNAAGPICSIVKAIEYFLLPLPEQIAGRGLYILPLSEGEGRGEGCFW